ncbi:hypothetical protein E2562_031685 [Oryza meyeriana var. granulata]|uniref:DUF868 domain-containing protein n=1 Tax=Oryza meyeriana var. granulata TaxID=110450 RepID=A0A6G1E4W8_9ORYZ|nr:hypothetical protein E2562_031685 [Oryza meyeriana var. granulata]KAF0919828.1 hypothetical protein E2562_031685 [Oryza meyeriana var. granulata]
MPSAIAACFRCAPAAAAAASGATAAAGPSLATSVYETHLGLAALSWTRTSLGLSLRAVLRLSSPATPGSSSAGTGAYFDEDSDEETLAFRVRPWLLWRRRGSRRFRAGDRRVDLAWDLTRSRFPGSGSPEPSSGFFVAVVVDGEMVLVAGDLSDAAYRKTRARRPTGPRPVLLSRREHVAMRDAGLGRGHRSWVTVRGKEREISVDLVSRGRGRDRSSREKDRADVGLSVSIDGERVLHVRRLRWKFRGSERVDLGGGDRVQLSWDLHNWLFPQREPPPTDAAAHAHAVFVFRFELGGGEEHEGSENAKALSDKAPRRDAAGILRGYFARWGQKDWSETGSNGERRKKGRGRRLAKGSSSSSASVASSTASWASGSTVMDWASPEEAEMQRGDGFSLLIYAWKS